MVDPLKVMVHQRGDEPKQNREEEVVEGDDSKQQLKRRHGSAFHNPNRDHKRIQEESKDRRESGDDEHPHRDVHVYTRSPANSFRARLKGLSHLHPGIAVLSYRSCLVSSAPCEGYDILIKEQYDHCIQY